MKRAFCGFLGLVLLLALLPAGAWAAEPQFAFSAAVNGGSAVSAAPGDIVTVTLTLNRTDADADFTMYAMQNELHYDAEFFEPVEGSALTAAGVQTADLALRDHRRACYMNFLSASGGEPWKGSTLIGSIQLKVKAGAGAARICCRNMLVSRQDGSGSYPVTGNEVLVVVSDRCTVRFDACGGTQVPEQIVTRGEKITEPTPPSRPGYRFEGWYQDVDCTQRWVFSRDAADVNLHLYAKWEHDGSAPLFSDVLPGDWFYADVQYAAQSGLMNGVSGGRFAPLDNTSRAMIVTILWRLEGSPAPTGASAFLDVDPAQWYGSAVRWAAENAIVKGYDAQTFGPGDPITREQIAAILYRYAAFRGQDTAARTPLEHFSDHAKIGSWARDALSWANASGLIGGLPDGRCAPQGPATRCQTAAILHRFCKLPR